MASVRRLAERLCRTDPVHRAVVGASVAAAPIAFTNGMGNDGSVTLAALAGGLAGCYAPVVVPVGIACGTAFAVGGASKLVYELSVTDAAF